MRWWFGQEAIALAEQSDEIQNGLVQDLFALRLSLQSVSSDSAALTQHQQDWITTTTQIHHHFTALSFALTPPYLAESLPLAIQSHLKRWQLTHPDCKLQLEFCSDWQAGTVEYNRLILKMLETLLRLTVSPSFPANVLHICLSNRSTQAELIVKLTFANRSIRVAATHAKELKYLRYCFHCLIPGRCSTQHRLHEAVWRFQWKQ